jgi:hypothetical protein
MNLFGRQNNFTKLMQLQSRLGNCQIIKPGRSSIKESELQKVSRKTRVNDANAGAAWASLTKRRGITTAFELIRLIPHHHHRGQQRRRR